MQTDVDIFSKNIARWAMDAGWTPDLGGYELSDADHTYIRCELSDADIENTRCLLADPPVPSALPPADESTQRAFEREVEETVNEILRAAEGGAA